MSHQARCVRTRLATGPVGHVDHCSCGAVYLTSGALSVRLEPRAFHLLSTLVQSAEVALDQLNPARPALRLVDAQGGDA